MNEKCIMPEMPYCPACTYGYVTYDSNEVECKADIPGSSCGWHCKLEEQSKSGKKHIKDSTELSGGHLW